MPRKTKRQTRRSIASAGDISGTSASGAGRSYSSEFKPDYSYVITDLRRIAMLAGSFFVILIILAIVLP